MNLFKPRSALSSNLFMLVAFPVGLLFVIHGIITLTSAFSQEYLFVGVIMFVVVALLTVLWLWIIIDGFESVIDSDQRPEAYVFRTWDDMGEKLTPYQRRVVLLMLADEELGGQSTQYFQARLYGNKHTTIIANSPESLTN